MFKMIHMCYPKKLSCVVLFLWWALNEGLLSMGDDLQTAHLLFIKDSHILRHIAIVMLFLLKKHKQCVFT